MNYCTTIDTINNTAGDISVYLFTPSRSLVSLFTPNIQLLPFDVCVPMPLCQYHLFVRVPHSLSNTHTFTYAFLALSWHWLNSLLPLETEVVSGWLVWGPSSHPSASGRQRDIVLFWLFICIFIYSVMLRLLSSALGSKILEWKWRHMCMWMWDKGQSGLSAL